MTEASRLLFSGLVDTAHRLRGKTVLLVAEPTGEPYLGQVLIVGYARASVTGLDSRRDEATADGRPRALKVVVDWSGVEPDLVTLRGLPVREERSLS